MKTKKEKTIRDPRQLHQTREQIYSVKGRGVLTHIYTNPENAHQKTINIFTKEQKQ